MKNAMIIGGGQLGSRHLQALKQVTQPLNITVVDPSAGSLEVAKERYDSVEVEGGGHPANYVQAVPSGMTIDLVIVATNSNVRANVVRTLLNQNTVKYMVLEKLLFQDANDYDAITALVNDHGAKAWVNCCMRMMPFYASIAPHFANAPIQYTVSGSNIGLVTNAIHYIDHMAHLTSELNYTLDTSQLDTTPIDSKRAGFMELHGTLRVIFADGSVGAFTCYKEGDAPGLVEISNRNYRCVSRESEWKAWTASSAGEWKWEEVDARIPFQSEMTAWLANALLETGTCDLVSLEDSCAIHRPLHEGLLNFLEQVTGERPALLPFT